MENKKVVVFLSCTNKLKITMTVEMKVDQLMKRFALGAWPKEHSISCVEEIIEALKITTGHCSLLKLDAQEVQMDIEYWERIKTQLQSQ